MRLFITRIGATGQRAAQFCTANSACGSECGQNPRFVPELRFPRFDFSSARLRPRVGFPDFVSIEKDSGIGSVLRLRDFQLSGKRDERNAL